MLIGDYLVYANDVGRPILIVGGTYVRGSWTV